MKFTKANVNKDFSKLESPEYFKRLIQHEWKLPFNDSVISSGNTLSPLELAFSRYHEAYKKVESKLDEFKMSSSDTKIDQGLYLINRLQIAHAQLWIAIMSAYNHLSLNKQLIVRSHYDDKGKERAVMIIDNNSLSQIQIEEIKKDLFPFITVANQDDISDEALNKTYVQLTHSEEKNYENGLNQQWSKDFSRKMVVGIHEMENDSEQEENGSGALERFVNGYINFINQKKAEAEKNNTTDPFPHLQIKDQENFKERLKILCTGLSSQHAVSAIAQNWQRKTNSNQNTEYKIEGNHDVGYYSSEKFQHTPYFNYDNDGNLIFSDFFETSTIQEISASSSQEIDVNIVYGLEVKIHFNENKFELLGDPEMRIALDIPPNSIRFARDIFENQSMIPASYQDKILNYYLYFARFANSTLEQQLRNHTPAIYSPLYWLKQDSSSYVNRYNEGIVHPDDFDFFETHVHDMQSIKVMIEAAYRDNMSNMAMFQLAQRLLVYTLARWDMLNENSRQRFSYLLKIALDIHDKNSANKIASHYVKWANEQVNTYLPEKNPASAQEVSLNESTEINLATENYKEKLLAGNAGAESTNKLISSKKDEIINILSFDKNVLARAARSNTDLANQLVNPGKGIKYFILSLLASFNIYKAPHFLFNNNELLQISSHQPSLFAAASNLEPGNIQLAGEAMDHLLQLLQYQPKKNLELTPPMEQKSFQSWLEAARKTNLFTLIENNFQFLSVERRINFLIKIPSAYLVELKIFLPKTFEASMKDLAALPLVRPKNEGPGRLEKIFGIMLPNTDISIYSPKENIIARFGKKYLMDIGNQLEQELQTNKKIASRVKSILEENLHFLDPRQNTNSDAELYALFNKVLKIASGEPIQPKKLSKEEPVPKEKTDTISQNLELLKQECETLESTIKAFDELTSKHNSSTPIKH